MSDHQFKSPVVIVPDDLKELESEFQRILYVENRIGIVSSLKHDRMRLKERFLQALVPPDLQSGFSEEINRLSVDNERLHREIEILRSQVDRAKREQINVLYERTPPTTVEPRESADGDSIYMRSVKHPNRKFWLLIAIALLFYGIGRIQGVSYSPSPVESGPVGVEHSNGGTTNGHFDQPKQGPSSSGKGNRRLP